LSSRDYRTDVLHRACVWISDPAIAPCSLSELATALEFPVFALYLGRKSCPLSLPLQPQVLRADSLRAAFDAALFDDSLLGDDLTGDDRIGYCWDQTDQAGMLPSQTITLRDQPYSRRRWQFLDRQVHFRGEPRSGG